MRTFEEQFKSCFNIIDDLDALLRAHCDRAVPLTADELANIIIGLEYLYKFKLEELLEIYKRDTGRSGDGSGLPNR